MDSIVIGLAVIGFGASVYAFILERKIKADSSYKAACDISSKVSCSKPITSGYGKILGISNALIGMLFYGFVAVLSLLKFNMLLFAATAASLLASAYLAYILYVKIRSVCLICTTIYIVNIALFVVSYIRLS